MSVRRASHQCCIRRSGTYTKPEAQLLGGAEVLILAVLGTASSLLKFSALIVGVAVLWGARDEAVRVRSWGCKSGSNKEEDDLDRSLHIEIKNLWSQAEEMVEFEKQGELP